MIYEVNDYLPECHISSASLSDIVFCSGSQLQPFVIKNKRKQPGISLAQVMLTSTLNSTELVEANTVDI